MSGAPATALASAAFPRESPRLLRAVLGATFFIRFGFGLTVSIFAWYLEGRFVNFSATDVGTVGLVTALAPLGEFATVLFAGMAADRYGRFPVLLAGTGGSAVLLAAISFTRAELALAGTNLLFGVTSGAILASSLAVIGDQAARRERGYEMGRFDAVNLLGYVLGFAFGLGSHGILSNAQLPWLFRAGAVLLAAGFLFAVGSARGHRELQGAASFRLWGIRQAVLRRDVLLLTMPWLVIYMLLGTAFVFLGTAATSVGLPGWEVAALIGAGGCVLLLSQPYYGRLSDRFGRVRLLLVGTAGFVGLLVCGGLVPWYGATPVLLAGIGVSAVAALGYGPASLASLADASRAMSRGTTMAVYSLAVSLGMVLGLALSTGLYSALGYAGLDLFFGLVAVGLAAFTLVRWRDLRRGAAAGEADPEPAGPTTPAR